MADEPNDDSELSADEFQPSSKNKSEVKKKAKTDFKCKFCARNFPSSANINRHQNVCPKNPNKSAPKFKCSHCSHQFRRADHLHSHVKHIHKATSKSRETMAEPTGDNQCQPAAQNISGVQQEASKDFKCTFCARSFTSSANISRHKTVCLQNPKKSSPKFKCDQCSQQFQRADHLRAHKKHPCLSSSKHQARSKCMFPDCDEIFFHKTSLIEHINHAHKDNDNSHEPVRISFPCLADFITWKEVEEEKNFSYFSMHEGRSKKRGDNLYLYCQHDGSAKAHLKTEETRRTPRVRSGGGIKRGSLCLAHMKVKRIGNGVSVEYFPLHSHKIDPEDFKHQPLTKATYELIDQQLAWDVAPSAIKKLLEEGAFHRENRDGEADFKRNHFVSEKLIRERKRRTRNAKRHNEDDATSVQMLYEELKNEKHNPVVIYKPIASKVVQGPPEANNLPDDVFMFGIQTKSQEELLKQGASKAVLIDETHGTNQYDFQLLTVMVPDENNRCWPAAHLITSKSDAETLQYFFMALRDKIPNLNINCVMTDDTNVFINAMEAAYQKPLRHLLCIWHLHQTFQRAIPKRSVPGFHTELYNDLKVIIGCSDINTFESLCEAFLKKYSTTAPNFVDYLRTSYLKDEERKKKWAMCHRNFYHANIETTGSVESFHSRLKKKYMQRKPNKRIDDLIMILLRIEEDDYGTRKRESVFGLAGSSCDAISLRHERAMVMSDDLVEVYLFGTAYFIKSSKEPEKTKYHICLSQSKCFRKTCRDSCKEAECSGLCGHLYYCSCPDKSPLCKHIHKLHSFLLKTGFLVATGARDLEEERGNIDDETSVQFCCNSDPWDGENNIGERSKQRRLENLDQNLMMLKEFSDSRKIPDVLVAYADTVIADLLKRIKSSIQSDCPPLQKMVPTCTYASNEKLVTQAQQMSSFKRPPAKKKRGAGLNQKLSVAEKEEVKKSLLSVLDENCDNDDVNDDMDSVSIPTDPHPIAVSDVATVKKPLSNQQTIVIELMTSPPESAETIADNSPPNDHMCENEPVYSSFTPHIRYCDKPNQTILKVGKEQITLGDLKGLDLQLSPEEVKHCEGIEKGFHVGWISQSIIDSFFHVMNENFPDSVVVSSYLSTALLRGQTIGRGIQKAAGKKLVIFPCVNKYHWTMVAFHTEKAEIYFFDSLQNPLHGDSYKLVVNAASALSKICPNIKKWQMYIMKHDKQRDSHNCGVHSSLFGHQLMAEHDIISPLTDAAQYRQFMYNVIVGNCLKRKSYEDGFKCGVCEESTVDCAAVACWKCDQWFHETCISKQVEQSPFICPEVTLNS